MMRAAALIALMSICGCVTAHAQAWDSRYPVCEIVHMRSVSYNDCRFTAIEQCRLAASGLAAQCVENPFFAGAVRNPDRQQRRRMY